MGKNGNGNGAGSGTGFDIGQLRVEPGSKVKLAKIDPSSTPSWKADNGVDDKEQAAAKLAELTERLTALQSMLWAQSKERVLVVLQAMDGGGKDGTIRTVLSGLNPQGIRVQGFKAPTSTELGHDYLWRVHASLPARGELGVFNRSHYEDVLVVRVAGLVPTEQWRRRYRHIVEFERMLVDEGTTIVKCFLHISRHEQAEVFRERLADPAKRWKFRAADLDVRAQWDDYQHAYAEAIEATSSEHAPWHVIPADRNWVRNLAVAELLRHTLRGMDPRYPEPEEGLASLTIAD